MLEKIDIKKLEDLRYRLAFCDVFKNGKIEIKPDEIGKMLEFLKDKSQEKNIGKIIKIWGKLDQNYPLDYILQKINYPEFTIFLQKGVFIPRTETEFGVKKVLKKWGEKLPENLVDLCSGTGFISLILSKNLKNKKILAVDISKKAVKIGQKNMKKNGVKNVKIIQNNGLKNLENKENLENWALFCNPPYVPREFEDSVKFEPKRAIYSGKNGLNFYKKMIKSLETFENKPKFIWLELDPRNIKKAQEILEKNPVLTFKKIEILPDQFGLNRFLIANNL